MLTLSDKLSRPWTCLKYPEFELYTFNTTVPLNHGAKEVFDIETVQGISGWYGDRVSIHINPANRIFVVRHSNKTWISPWYSSAEVGMLEFTQLTDTVMNVIEFHLSWGNHTTFWKEYLEPALTKIESPVGKKKAWQLAENDDSYFVRYTQAGEHGKVVSPEQIRLLMLTPDLPVDVGHTPAGEAIIVVPKLESVYSDLFAMVRPNSVTIPAKTLTTSVINDTAVNIVKNDGKRWLPQLVKKGLDHEMIDTGADALSLRYHESVANKYPSFR